MQLENVTAGKERDVKPIFCASVFLANIEYVGDVSVAKLCIFCKKLLKKGNFVAALPLPPDWLTPVESRLWRSDLRFRLFWNGPIGTPDRMALFWRANGMPDLKRIATT
jgi:hypothetical protein